MNNVCTHPPSVLLCLKKVYDRLDLSMMPSVWDISKLDGDINNYFDWYNITSKPPMSVLSLDKKGLGLR